MFFILVVCFLRLLGGSAPALHPAAATGPGGTIRLPLFGGAAAGGAAATGGAPAGMFLFTVLLLLLL